MKTIECLAPNEWKILKQIIIISNRNNNDVEYGRIYYTRSISENYNFIKQKLQDENEEQNLKNSFSKLLNGYPEQKNYPEDDVDLIILQAIKKVYPKSYVYNDSIFFNVELEKIENLKKRNTCSSHITFLPGFFDLSNLYQYAGKQFNSLRIPINIYGFNACEHFQHDYFTSHYQFSNKSIIDKLKLVAFE